jgi:hypothetical protein
VLPCYCRRCHRFVTVVAVTVVAAAVTVTVTVTVTVVVVVAATGVGVGHQFLVFRIRSHFFVVAAQIRRNVVTTQLQC